MKNYFLLLAVCLMSACMGGGSGASVSSLTAPDVGSGSASIPPSAPSNNTFAGMLNNVRAANGARPVTFDARLGSAAQAHANDMLRNNYFSHTGLNGSNPGQRIKAAGYDWRTYGENIAQGYNSEQDVMRGWTNSPDHHSNNIDPRFEEFGLAKAGSGGQKRWVLVLATERR